jgi:hypothetical protein
MAPQVVQQDISYLYDAPEFQEGQSVVKKNISSLDTASKFSRRRVNPVLKIMNYITNVKFNGKERYSDRRSSAFRKLDDGIDIDLNTKKIINYMDFVHSNKDLVKPKPIYPSLNVKRQRDDSSAMMVSEGYDQSATKRRRIDSESRMSVSEQKGLNRIRSAMKDDVSMKSVNSVLTSRQSNIEMKSYQSKSLEQIQKEIMEKKKQNQKMLDEISERNSRRSLMLIDQESKVDYSEKRKIIANYYKEKSRASMEDLDLINDNYLGKRGRRPKFEQLSCSNSSLTFEAMKRQPAVNNIQKEEFTKIGNTIRVPEVTLNKEVSFSDGKQVTFGGFSSDKLFTGEAGKILDNKPLPVIAEEKEDKKLTPSGSNLFANYAATNMPKPEGSKPFEGFKSLEKPKEPVAFEIKDNIKKVEEPLKSIETTKSEIKIGSLFSSPGSTFKPQTVEGEKKEISLFGNNKPEEKKPEESKFNTFMGIVGVQQKTVEAKPNSSLFGERKNETILTKPVEVSTPTEKKEEQQTSLFTKAIETTKDQVGGDKAETGSVDSKKLLFGSFGGTITTSAPLGTTATFGFKEKSAETSKPDIATTEAPKIEVTKTEIPKSETKKEEVKSDSAIIKSFIPVGTTTITTSTIKTTESKSGDLFGQIEKKDDLKTFPPLTKIETPQSSLLLNQNNPFVSGASKSGTPNLFRSSSPKKGKTFI